MDTIPIPVPPLPEQRRIVERIERLFARLDEAARKAQSVLDSCETRKAAILHKAFTGYLTGIGGKNGHNEKSMWSQIVFGDLVKESRLGLIRSKIEQSDDKEYYYLKMNNITSDGSLDLSNLLRVNASQEEISSYALKDGDFLFNTRNSYDLVGKNTVWISHTRDTVLFNNNIMRVRFKQLINPFFVSYYLNSETGRTALTQIKKNTTNVAAIYAKDLYGITIPVPSLDEQNNIVQILGELSKSEHEIRIIAMHALTRIAALKQSILARAFRGELGTNDPAEPAALI